MKKTIHPLLAIAIVLAAACGGSDSVERRDAEYESVQEGSASGVTTTLHGPGEVVPPMTATNADTTTAFALDPAAAGAAPSPLPPSGGTILGTLPPPEPSPAVGYPATPRPTPPMTSAPATPSAPRRSTEGEPPPARSSTSEPASGTQSPRREPTPIPPTTTTSEPPREEPNEREAPAPPPPPENEPEEEEEEPPPPPDEGGREL